MRLDHYVVEQGWASSRNKAQELIKNHAITLEGKILTKVSFEVTSSMRPYYTPAPSYVSRSAWKLKGFLPYTGWSLVNLEALDIGSSTGGFTQVLLEEGVKHVSAVDVGSDQLHPTLRTDERISLHEQCDIRSFVHPPFELVTCDVAFISLLHLLPTINALASKYIILLFKPQFEVGKEVKRDKNGVIKEDKAIHKAMIHFEDQCALMGWKLIAKEPALVRGKEGNQEMCYGFITSAH